MENKRRDFIKQLSITGAAMAAGSLVSCTEQKSEKNEAIIETQLIVPKAQGLKLTGTFIDEISHDIPHQNWGEKEWDQDFA